MAYQPNGNPAQDDSIQLLSRILKTLESLTIVDSGQRQKVTIDSITGSLTLGTITTVSTVSAVTAITNALPAGANVIGGITTVAGMDREMYINQARTAYAMGIRTKLN